MQKLRDFFAGFSMLKDWQDEVNRAYDVAEFNCRPVRKPPEETPTPFHRDAVVLDLAAYRAKKESA